VYPVHPCKHCRNSVALRVSVSSVLLRILSAPQHPSLVEGEAPVRLERGHSILRKESDAA
jgi:hypothetical protein